MCINLISFLVLSYLVFYGVYLLTINLKALFAAKKFLVLNSPDEFKEEIKENQICVIIFANSKSKKIEPLLKSLNEQEYNKENYSVHVVFAQDSTSASYTPDCMAGAQIHCIQNEEFFKKNKALNLFIEKLLVNSKFDAYVFLGADRFIKKDYLKIVNITLNKFKSCALTGKTVVEPAHNDKSIKSKVLQAKKEFINNTTNISRRIFDLAAVIDSENCVITSDILEKTGRICFETKEDELKYSLFLASNNIKPVYSPYIETYLDAENYNPATAGIGVRISLFKYYLKLLIKKPWYFVEFTISLIQPNVAVAAILYFTLLYCSFNFITTIKMKYILHLGIFYLGIWAIGLFASKLNAKKVLIFVLYPFYSFIFNFGKITRDIARRAIQRTFLEEKNIKSATMDAYVTDGKKDVMCKMDLISEDGMRRVILRFRKKRVISDESIRMYDAIHNISKKVKAHGVTLKACQNCTHFETLQDGTVDLLKGTCCAANNDSENSIETLVWNRCDLFEPKTETSVIDNLNNNK